MSYIEREAAYTLAKKIVDAVHSGEYSSIQLPHFILDAIDDIPAADVRTVQEGGAKMTGIERLPAPEEDEAWTGLSE